MKINFKNVETTVTDIKSDKEFKLELRISLIYKEKSENCRKPWKTFWNIIENCEKLHCLEKPPRKAVKNGGCSHTKNVIERIAEKNWKVIAMLIISKLKLVVGNLIKSRKN